MSSGETFADNTQELLSHVSFYSCVERWILPRDVSFSCAAGVFPVIFRVELQFICLSAVV